MSPQTVEGAVAEAARLPGGGGGSGGGGGTSVWGYLTAGVVAANVVANLVNSANQNNNNNNNNNNQDSSNNNNMNVGNSANSNMNMNIIIPVPGGRAADARRARASPRVSRAVSCSAESRESGNKGRIYQFLPNN